MHVWVGSEADCATSEWQEDGCLGWEESAECRVWFACVRDARWQFAIILVQSGGADKFCLLPVVQRPTGNQPRHGALFCKFCNPRCKTSYKHHHGQISFLNTKTWSLCKFQGALATPLPKMLMIVHVQILLSEQFIALVPPPLWSPGCALQGCRGCQGWNNDPSPSRTFSVYDLDDTLNPLPFATARVPGLSLAVLSRVSRLGGWHMYTTVFRCLSSTHFVSHCHRAFGWLIAPRFWSLPRVPLCHASESLLVCSTDHLETIQNLAESQQHFGVNTISCQASGHCVGKV